jgi:hypothetical protein
MYAIIGVVLAVFFLLVCLSLWQRNNSYLSLRMYSVSEVMKEGNGPTVLYSGI